MKSKITNPDYSLSEFTELKYSELEESKSSGVVVAKVTVSLNL